jgi:beta-lactamase family protein
MRVRHQFRSAFLTRVPEPGEASLARLALKGMFAFIGLLVLNHSQLGVVSAQEGPSPLPSPAATEPELSLPEGPVRVSAAVTEMSGTPVFVTNPHDKHTLASVAKVYILAAFMDRVGRERREFTEEESTLMAEMVEVSDNSAATELYRRVGGRNGLLTYLAEHRMSSIEVPRDGSWGDIRASGTEVAQFLLNLYKGELLSPEHTKLALGYLSDIIADHSWGVGTAGDSGPERDREMPNLGRGNGAPGQRPGDRDQPGTTPRPQRQTVPDSDRRDRVYFKNGWYPGDDGWIVNSVGIIDGVPSDYVVVLLTDSQPSFEDGQRYVDDAMRVLQERFDRFGHVQPSDSG